VVLHNFNVLSAIRPVGPNEANTPLCINPDAVLPFSFPGESFETIAWQLGEITERRGSFKNAQSPFRLLPKSLESRDALAFSEA
jgi:hypothetical protein